MATKGKRAVRGPQRKLDLAGALPSARGGKRKRMRPGTGNPLVAFRVPAECWAAYVAKHGGAPAAYVALKRHVMRGGAA